MSTAEAPVETVNGHGNPGTADGSPPGGTASQETADREEGTDEGAEPNSGASGSGESPAAEMARLRAEREQLEQERDDYRDKFRQLNDDPEVIAAFMAARNGKTQEAADPIDAIAEELFGKLDRGTENEGAWKKSMATALRTAAQEGARMAMEQMDPKLREVAKSVTGGRYERALDEFGVPTADQRTPEFRKFTARLDREAPSYRKMTPEDAGRFVAREWANRSQTRTRNVEDRQRIEDAKGAKLNGSSPRGGPTSKTEFKSLDDYIKARASGFSGLGR